MPIPWLENTIALEARKTHSTATILIEATWPAPLRLPGSTNDPGRQLLEAQLEHLVVPIKEASVAMFP